jgi:hypothetical protein
MYRRKLSANTSFSHLSTQSLRLPTMATQSTENESWDRLDLSQRGFFYDEDSRPPRDPLPSHVEALRESMLDFAFDLASQRKHEAELTVSEKTRLS